MASVLIGPLAASWSVSLFANMVTVLYVFLGRLGSLPELAQVAEQIRQPQFTQLRGAVQPRMTANLVFQS